MNIHLLETVLNDQADGIGPGNGDLLMWSDKRLFKHQLINHDSVPKYFESELNKPFLIQSDIWNRIGPGPHSTRTRFQNTGYWGALNRQFVLDHIDEYRIAPDDWIINTEADNIYNPALFDLIQSANDNGRDMVCWSIVHHNLYGKAYQLLKPQLRPGGCDWVSFAVKAKHLKAVGIVDPTEIDSDGRTAQALKDHIQAGAKFRIEYSDQILVMKN